MALNRGDKVLLSDGTSGVYIRENGCWSGLVVIAIPKPTVGKGYVVQQVWAKRNDELQVYVAAVSPRTAVSTAFAASVVE